MKAECSLKTLVPIYQTACVTSQKIRIMNKDAEINKNWLWDYWCEYCHLSELPHFS
jgi:hypothetical protein